MKPTYLICTSCYGRRRFHAFGIQSGTFQEDMCPKCKAKKQKKEAKKTTFIRFQDRVVDRAAYTYHGMNPSDHFEMDRRVTKWCVHIHWKPGSNSEKAVFETEEEARAFFDSITEQL